MKVWIVSFVCFASSLAWGQYEDYRSYETFSELDKDQRDFGLVLAPAVFYNHIEENNETSTGTPNDRTRQLLFYDIHLGYIFRSGFYFGILYEGESQDINGSSPMSRRSSLGASFGYRRYGWALTGTFFPYSRQDLDNADIADYSEGLGYQLDLAYYFRLGRYFSVGPQLVFKSFQYREAEVSGINVTLDASSQHDIFTPMISFMINLYRD